MTPFPNPRINLIDALLPQYFMILFVSCRKLLAFRSVVHPCNKCLRLCIDPCTGNARVLFDCHFRIDYFFHFRHFINHFTRLCRNRHIKATEAMHQHCNGHNWQSTASNRESLTHFRDVSSHSYIHIVYKAL